MTGNEYQKLALVTAQNLDKDKALLSGVMGLCGEAGEAIDIVKKHLFHSHPLNKEKLLEELGDVAWYLAISAYALDADLDKVLSDNIEKLKRRYPQGFDPDRSLNRKKYGVE